MRHVKILLVPYSRKYSNKFRGLNSNLISPELESEFKNSLKYIVNGVSNKRIFLSLCGMKEHIFRSAGYNMNFEKNPSRIIMLHSYTNLENAEPLPPEAKNRAFVLAWAIEMMHSYNFILGGSKTKHEETTTRSIGIVPNDANMLRSFMYEMLKDNFGGTLYEDILQFYNKAFLYTAAGNYLDNYITNKGKTDKFTNFEWKTYEMLNEYKTAYNTFKLPLFVAAFLTQKPDNVLHDHLHKMCSDLSILYQMQEEYEDCFGYESKTYKSAGRNIQEGKCTWLAVSALQRCTSAQRVVFNACYGSSEPAHVERIKLLYDQLKLPQKYREEEGTFCESIMQRAESIESSGVPLALFSKLLDGMCRK